MKSVLIVGASPVRLVMAGSAYFFAVLCENFAYSLRLKKINRKDTQSRKRKEYAKALTKSQNAYVIILPNHIPRLNNQGRNAQKERLMNKRITNS